MKKLIAALSLLALGTSTNAVQLRLDGFSTLSASNSIGKSGWLLEMTALTADPTLSLNPGDNLLMLCFDPYSTSSVGLIDEYVVNPLSDYIADVDLVEGAVARMGWEDYAANSMVENSALTNIIYEARIDGAFDFSADVFRTGDALAWSATGLGANAWASLVDGWVLDSLKHQDGVVFREPKRIPEPTPLALMGLGLIGLARKYRS